MNAYLKRLMGVALMVMAGAAAQAQLIWTANVNNISWDTSSANWSNGGAGAVYADGSNVVFNDASSVGFVNIVAPVSPGSIIFSNSNNRSYVLTNGILTGSGSITRYNTGYAQFGSGSTNNLYAGSMSFSGGTYLQKGSVNFATANTDDTAKATGGVPFGFGTGVITFYATNAGFKFSGYSASTKLTNDIVVMGGGGMDLNRFYTQANPQNNFAGNIAIYSPNTFGFGSTFSAYGAAGANDKSSRIMTGITSFYTNGTIGLTNPVYNGRALSYEQNMVSVGGSFGATIIPNGSCYIEISGNNTGLLGGITVLAPNIFGSQAAPLVFVGSTNTLSPVVNVSSGAYVGLQMPIDATTMGMINFSNGATLGLESNTAYSIDLSAMSRDLWIGSTKGAVYSGTLTPYGSTYRFGGGGSPDNSIGGGLLVLSGVNALTGARDVQVGDPTSLLQPGLIVLASSNSFTGGVTINAGRGSGNNYNAGAVLIARSAGALGTGPIQINRSSGVGNVPPTLQFEVSPPYTFTNSIVVTNGLGAGAISTLWPLVLQGNLTVYGTNTLYLMNTNGPQACLVFNQVAAGNTVSWGTGGLLDVEWGALDPVSLVNVPTNIGVRINGGALILSPSFTWSNLVANSRTWVTNTLPGATQWTGRNFAGKGATQIIDWSGTFASGFSSNWLTLSGAMGLGSVATNSDGSFYADAGVKITRDLYIGSNALTITVASSGPGLTNPAGVGVVHELTGTISGPGSLAMGTAGTVTDGQIPELILSGSSVWTGGICEDYQSSQRILSGPGGLSIPYVGSGSSGFIRFNGNDSLPHGNSGASAYIQALGRANANRFGYLLTGSGSGQVYTLASGMRFLLGGGGIAATFGASQGTALLTNSMITVWNSGAGFESLNLLTRETNTVLILGSSAGPVRFSGATTSGGIAAGWYSSASNATPLIERSLSTFVKRGPGTLVLSNIAYTALDGTGDTTTNFFWQNGSGTLGADDGVILETGLGVSNSLRTIAYTNKGAVYGLIADYTPAFNTFVTNSSAPLVVMIDSSGGGFAAYGGKHIVTLTAGGGYNYVQWGQSNINDWRNFLKLEAPLILSAKDATAPIEITMNNASNYIYMTSVNNEIRVYDNPNTNSDWAIVSARMGPGGGSRLTKTGAGTLVLSAVSNNYQMVTWVSNGTLIVNGWLTPSASNVIVCSGATFGGTGVVARPVVVQAGGFLTAGTVTNGIGTLTISSNLTLNGTLTVDLSATTSDRVSVNGSVTFGAGATVTINNGYDIAGGDTRTILTAAGGFSGTIPTTSEHNYSIVQPDANTLVLKRNSPGFIFRIQ